MFDNGRRLSAALITPTFRLDLERCELLVESVRRCAPSLAHYLIVDKCDLSVFRHLEGPMTRVVVSASLLPAGFRRLPIGKSIWVGPGLTRTRGWIVQQVLKIAIAEHVTEDILIFCDSDLCFVRPFDVEQVVSSGSVHLLDVDYNSDEVSRWTNVAAQLLALDDTIEARGHVGNVICWRRENVLALVADLSKESDRDWRYRLLSLPTVSEYILYGVYVRSVLGYPASGQHPSTVPFAKASWGSDLSSTEGMDEFFASFDPATVAVMVHSKDGVAVASYRDRVEAMWPVA